MKIGKILMALMMLPFLCGCEADLPQEPKVENHKLTVRASLPDEVKSRAQIVYGTPREDADGNIQGEIFRWNEEEEVNVFNLNNLEKFPLGVIFGSDEISEDGSTAVFSSNDPSFTVQKDDLILAIYSQISRPATKDEYGKVHYDERNIIKLNSIGTEANAPQYIVNNPTPGHDGLDMKKNIHMYALVKVVEDGQMPDLHFHHFSALMRVTLRNKSGHDIYPTKLEFEYPGTESFFDVTMFFSVVSENDLEGNQNNIWECYEDESGTNWCNYPSALSGYYLRVYGGKGFYTNSDKQYSDKICTTINGKSETDDVGEAIPNDSIYQLYITTVPKLRNIIEGTPGLSIHLIEKHDTGNPYSVTITGFNKVIEAGKRYWFDLTATPAGTLVLTSKFNPDDYKTPVVPES